MILKHLHFNRIKGNEEPIMNLTISLILSRKSIQQPIL